MDAHSQSRDVPILTVPGPWNWDTLLAGTGRASLAEALAATIVRRRWFGGKARSVASLEILEAISLSPTVRLLLAKVEFTAGPSEVYQIPLAFAPAELAARVAEREYALSCQVRSQEALLGVLYDALDDVDFCGQLMELFEAPRTFSGARGVLNVTSEEPFDRLRGDRFQRLPPKPMRVEQSNTSVVYGDRLILKLFRRVEMGLNPDFEISAHLTRQGFGNTPALAGSVLYHPAEGEPWTLAMLQAFVPNRGDAWKLTQDWLSAALRGVAAQSVPPPVPEESLVLVAERPILPAARAAFGEFLAMAELLGRRTAEMHLALAANRADAAFAPEPLTRRDRREFIEHATEQSRETFTLLAGQLSRLPVQTSRQAKRVQALEMAANERYARLFGNPIDVEKIRCHGDYHLGQVLATGDDFVIVDFEGEPLHSISQRRKKQLALRDAAGMIRSLHYASCAAASAARSSAERPPAERIDAWTRSWYAWSSVAFLAAYRQTAADAGFLPRSTDTFEQLLDAFLLEKAIYELRYELNNRPDWVYLPLAALEDLLA